MGSKRTFALLHLVEDRPPLMTEFRTKLLWRELLPTTQMGGEPKFVHNYLMTDKLEMGGHFNWLDIN